MSKYCVVFVTAASPQEGKKVARQILEKKAAACVNIVSGIKSHYWWQGKIETANEVLLIIKTKKSLFTFLETLVKKIHRYTVPEIICLPIEKGSKDYLAWIDSSTK
ncbi:MAG: divalent-cation tolerance protein CutA [Elusimicrobiota bacterium]